MTSPVSLVKISKTQTLDEIAYAQIKEAILNGAFQPGAFLAETRLAEELGISKTPIRKALGRLQQESFLTNIPFDGYYVADISIDDILEVYQLREILECFLVQATIGRFSPAELEAMRAILDRAAAALEQGNHVGFVEFNRQFHHTFDRKYDNQRITNVLANLDEHVQRILVYILPIGQAELAASHAEHYLILDAVTQEDMAAAVDLMRRHVARFRDVLVAVLERQPELIA